MAASAALSRSNLHSQSFWNVFNLLNNRSNVVDPVDGTGNRKMIYAHEPDLGRGFDGYPCIIITPFKIKVATRGNGIRTLSDKSAETVGETIIEVRGQDTFGKKGTAANPQGRGIADFDAVSDDIMETLQSATNRDTLRTYNMGKLDVEEGTVDFIDVENQTIYVREFRLAFDTKLLTVSS